MRLFDVKGIAEVGKLKFVIYAHSGKDIALARKRK
jgi:hypothetical protein